LTLDVTQQQTSFSLNHQQYNTNITSIERKRILESYLLSVIR